MAQSGYSQPGLFHFQNNAVDAAMEVTVYDGSIARSRTAANIAARDGLAGWQDQVLRTLRRQRARLASENASALRTVRRLRPHEHKPAHEAQVFSKAVRTAFWTAPEIARIDEAIEEIEQANFADLLPAFRAQRSAQSKQVAA